MPTVEDALARITREAAERLEAYWLDQCGGRVSTTWQRHCDAARLMAVAGCHLCGWHYPDRVMEVDGDLWCNHCVREYGLEIRVDARHIPGLVLD